MNENEYLETRLEDQVKWYSKQSQLNKQWYKILRSVELIAAASIPFITGYITPKTLNLKFAAGFLGLLVAIIAGLMSLNRFQELWIEYRTTAESLKHEKFLYLTKSEPYDIEESFALFVQSVETLISKEHSRWINLTKKSEKEQQPER